MEEKKTPTPKDNKKKGFNFYWIYGILTLAIITIGLWGWQPTMESIDNIRLERMIARGDIEKIVIMKQKEQAQIYIRASQINADTAYKKAFERSKSGPHYFIEIGDIATFSQEIKDAEIKAFSRDTIGKTAEEKYEIEKNFKRIVVVTDNSKSWGWEIIGWILPFLLIFGLFYWSMRGMGRAGGGAGGQIFNIGKSKAQLYDKNNQPHVTFNDVAGLESAKEEIVEIVDFLKNPKRYTSLGGKIPKGALLIGPPGTGKTLLARAVAGEAKVPFFSLSGSDFVEMFVGVGASRVRDLFKTAKEKAPCIIFIDEIDAVGRARGRNAMTGANDERENTLNQLLTEMDGFSTNAGIIMLAATNRADILDRALLRAGRFDRQIHVELPDVEERKEIFQVHSRALKLGKDVELEFFARQTPGFSGADIANVCNEAALIAARKNKSEIQKQDFLDAIDRIIGGLERRSKIISPKEKEVIAFHEAGHATVSWFLEHASPLVKVTIVPRGKSLGAAWYLPEERQITNTEQLMDELSATLGGRAAEDVVFGKISTGALNDLERVTKQAYAMVTYYGLNEKIGNLSYYDSSGQSEYSFNKPYSEATAQLIDEEVHKLIDSAYQVAKNILIEHKEQLAQLAQQLLEKEVIYREDLVAVFGERPFDEKEESKVMGKNVKLESENTQEEENNQEEENKNQE